MIPDESQPVRRFALIDDLWGTCQAHCSLPELNHGNRLLQNPGVITQDRSLIVRNLLEVRKDSVLVILNRLLIRQDYCLVGDRSCTGRPPSPISSDDRAR